MKQTIPLTDYNKQLLIDRYGMKPEEFTVEYWQKQVINSEKEMIRLINLPHKCDIQAKVYKRAKKLMKKNISHRLGLPNKSGSQQKQREWHRIFDRSGLKR